MTNDKNNENNQVDQQQWADAFNPNVQQAHLQKTYTQLMHEKEQRNAKELEKPEAQQFLYELQEGLKEPGSDE